MFVTVLPSPPNVSRTKADIEVKWARSILAMSFAIIVMA